VLVVWGAIRVRPKPGGHGQARLFLLSWALIPVSVLFAVSWTVRPVYVHRYLLFTLPAYVLLTTAGVLGCRRRALIRVLAAIVVGIHVLSAWSLLTSPRYARSDWRDAQQYLVSQVSSDDLVLFHPWLLRRPFDYYNSSLESVPESALETVGVPQGVEIVTDGKLLEEMDRIERSAREAQGLRLWIVEHQSDVRASDWMALQDSWHQVDVRRFEGGLLVGSYGFVSEP
jgi:hypothetical protein